VIEIDADRDYFREAGIKSATVRFFAFLGEKPDLQKSLTLRVDDPVNTNTISIFFDENEPIAYQVNWYGRMGEYQDDLKVLEGSYLFLVPPDRSLYKR
jgi:hypothetical protein